jgi:uncharacterized membrane protein YciS (DUF1049 family)
MALAPTSQEPQLTTGKLAIIAFNSTALYVLAYLIMHTVVQLSEVAMSYKYVIPTIITPSQLNFIIQDNEWRRSAVILIFAVGQTLALLLAGFFFLQLQSASERRGLAKGFYIWLVIHGCNQFFGAMAADNFVRQGFWLSPRWLFWYSNIPAVGLGFAFAMTCMVIGYKLSLPFLKTCDSISLIRLENRPTLIWTMIFAPWFLGTLLINACKFPVMTLLEHSHQLSILLILISMAVGCRYDMHEMTVQAPRRTSLSNRLIITMVVVLIAYRLVLQQGIHVNPHGYRFYPGREVADRI